MSIDTFQQRVSRAIKRGKVFDADIPGAAKDAIKSLERANNWKHMWTEENTVLPAGTSSLVIENLKTLRWVRRQRGTTDIYDPVKKVSSIQVVSVDKEHDPGAFWMSDQTTVEFDGEPTDDLSLQWGYWTYSTYDDNLAWLEVDESLLLAQTMIEMAPILKDDKITARYQQHVAGKVGILGDAEQDHEYDAQDQRMVPFLDEIEEFQRTGVDWDT